MPRYGKLPTSDPYDHEDEEEDFLQKQIRQQRQGIAEQDRDLELLSDSVTRLGEMSLEIGNEIQTQNRMITDLDVSMDEAVSTLDLVTGKTKDLIKKSGGPKWFLLIIVLSLMLAVLTFLVFWT